MMSLWDALRMNMMISYQELVRTFPNLGIVFFGILAEQAQLPEWLMMVFYLLLFAAYSLCLAYAWKVGKWVKGRKKSNTDPNRRKNNA
ncbi:hypothetical protein [Escherichia coli]|uniref:hypothetical protein n=1 Tax=Escherichia coli TaxID=562 RepID=UPI000399EB42|nr:hypothetical protein [Escherichia coli]KOA28173.1 hypothetical protein AC065_03995 [Escherichia coli]